MAQIMARISDELRARLKAKAAAEKRTLNDVITEALERAVGDHDERAALYARLEAQGKRVFPPRPNKVPTAAEIERLGRGAGSAVSEALARERARR